MHTTLTLQSLSALLLAEDDDTLAVLSARALRAGDGMYLPSFGGWVQVRAVERLSATSTSLTVFAAGRGTWAFVAHSADLYVVESRTL